MRDSVTLMEILFPCVTKYLIRSTPTRRGPRLHFISPVGFVATSVRISHPRATCNKTNTSVLVLAVAEDEGFEPSEGFAPRQFSKLLL